MGSSGRLCHPKGSSRKARLTRTGLRCEWTLPQRRLTMASRGESGKPTRHCRLRLALLSVLSPPRTEAGASSPAREAHGYQPNSRPVPSRKSAPESRKTRSDKVFRWALSDGIPSSNWCVKGLKKERKEKKERNPSSLSIETIPSEARTKG